MNNSGNAMDSKIVHDQKNHRFIVNIEGNACYLNYNLPRENVIDFNSTYVPGPVRGRGIAAQLVEEGLKFAENNKLRVIPSCSYVSLYIDRHEKYQKLL